MKCPPFHPDREMGCVIRTADASRVRVMRLGPLWGMQLAGRKDASLCILAGEERAVPPGLDPACSVECEEWLLLAAETYQLPERVAVA